MVYCNYFFATNAHHWICTTGLMHERQLRQHMERTSFSLSQFIRIYGHI